MDDHATPPTQPTRPKRATPEVPSSSGLVRDLELLHALASDEANQRGGLGVVRLAQILQREKSQVSRALKALEQVNLVERDSETREYRLGRELFSLAARMIEPRLMQIAPPVMRRLVGQMGESVHLCVLQGDQVLTVHTEAPRHHLRATGWVGRMIPGYCSSAGRVLFGDYSLEELMQRFSDVDFRPMGPGHLVNDVEGLYTQICLAKAQGYALVREEFEPELVGVSAPIRDFRGQIVAALNISGPNFRLGEQLIPCGQETAQAAQSLSVALGWSL
ncbi:MAG: IclR family transcriptional regulator [Phototrophicaceae bacterium]|jgi:DNA-binding IclR family transcriptional regulator